jgi:hypothetical protein
MARAYDHLPVMRIVHLQGRFSRRFYRAMQALDREKRRRCATEPKRPPPNAIGVWGRRSRRRSRLSHPNRSPPPPKKHRK